MVLLVKLKNLNRKGAASESVQPDTSIANDSSQGYESISEHQSSLSPPDTTISRAATSSDQGLDDLSAALQRTNINEVKDNVPVQHQDLPVNSSTIPHRPSIDVLVAPAVIGHRWVRTRSNSFVVERPERIRAVLLGLAAVVAKQEEESDSQDKQIYNLTDKLASISTQGNIAHLSNCRIGCYSSDDRLPLSPSSMALAMIHAYESETISVHSKDQAGQELYLTSKEIPYAAYLDNLCSLAPSEIPPTMSPSSLRSGLSPSKGQAELSREPIERPSEVPIHLPQGDLYLCGSRSEAKAESEDQVTSASISGLADESLRTPKTEESSRKSVSNIESSCKQEDDWRRGGSKAAIEAALGTACSAVDRVVAASRNIATPSKATVRSISMSRLESEARLAKAEEEMRPALRSFVIVRPPGHHCNATQPSGFCWVNNAAVMAAHAYHEHGIDRVAILDFDLHHGNGTQSIAWRINADTIRHDLEREAKRKARRAEQEKRGKKMSYAEISDGIVKTEGDKRGLKIFYGSLHDIESFPCEDGNKELVTDASMCIEGAHGQWIWNIHLEAQSNAMEARQLYDQKYSQLIEKARNFFAQTESTPDCSLILISAGFDACIHEQAGMQRHGKSVPPSFYEVFSRDAVALADERCAGKLISILEGGYSDRALTSATIAHLVGLGMSSLDEDVYQTSNLYQLEKVAKSVAANAPPRRKNDALSKDGVWLDYTREAFQRLEEACGRKRNLHSRLNEDHTSMPKTPDRGMMEQLWRSPREMRSGKGSATSA